MTTSKSALEQLAEDTARAERIDRYALAMFGAPVTTRDIVMARKAVEVADAERADPWALDGNAAAKAWRAQHDALAVKLARVEELADMWERYAKKTPFVQITYREAHTAAALRLREVLAGLPKGALEDVLACRGLLAHPPTTDRLGGGAMSAAQCPQSEREDGDHCAHSWTHDVCHWCGATFGEDPQPTDPEEGR